MPFNFGFDPASLISGIAQAQTGAQANEIAWLNLQFQKDQADKQYDLATATRTDAYGNTVSYNKALKKWEIVLTPQQQQILGAGEKEQLLSLTEDAGRNRDVRRRAGARGAAAEEDYNDALMGYRYDQPKSQEADFGELSTLLAAGQESNANQAASQIGRQAIRMGKGESIPEIIKASDDYLGQHMPDYILQAREKARSEHAQDVQLHDAQYLPELSHFEQTENDVPGTTPIFSQAPGSTAATEQSMLSSIAGALAQGSAGVGGAYGALASSIANSAPHISGLSFNGSFGGEGTKPNFMTVPPGNSIFDPSTGQVLFTAPVYGKGGGGAGAGGMPMSDFDTAVAALSRLAPVNGSGF